MGFIKKLLPEKMPDFWVKHYSKDVAEKIFLSQYKRMAEELPLYSGIILDLGTGPGYLPIEIVRRRPGIKVIGIDLSKKMLRIAKNNGAGINNLEFIIMDAKSLGLRESSVSFVISTGSFHHWKAPLRVFNEIYRVLKPDGQAWIYAGSSDVNYKNINLPEVMDSPWSKFIFKKIFRFYGFTKKAYKSQIEPVINKSLFKKAKLEEKGIWYRISLRKV